MTRVVDRERLRRALALDLEAVPPDGWAVSGGHTRHLVRAGVCDCEDRVRPCKHILAVELLALPQDVLVVLRQLVPGAVTPYQAPRPAGRTRRDLDG